MKLERYENNPILKPRGDDWEALAVFNCAALRVGDEIHILYRAVGEYLQYVSRLGHAVFDLRLNLIHRSESPVFNPDLRFWEMSIEDPRLVEIDGEIYMTYVTTPTPAPPSAIRIKLGLPKPKLAYSRCAAARVREFKEFERLGTITPYDAEERNTVLFPEKMDGRFVALHRPANWVGEKYSVDKPSIWIAFLDKIPGIMYDHRVVMKPEEDWESLKVGAGPPPIKTDKGWLLIYHGVDYEMTYRAGVALLDLEKPWTLISKTSKPILEPEMSYERYGDVPNVVFPTGAITVGEKLLVFYGGADKVCCMAYARIDELLSHLL